MLFLSGVRFRPYAAEAMRLHAEFERNDHQEYALYFICNRP